MTDPDRWTTELKHSWPLLRGATPTEIATSPLRLSVSGPVVRVGVDGRGARSLLVGTHGGEPGLDPAQGAVTMSLRTFTFGGTPQRYLTITCDRPDLFDLFDDLLLDVLAAVAAAGEDTATAACDAVMRWRSLLAAGRPGHLSHTSQMALFAELYVLNLVTSGGELDISCWRGPLREHHDIVLPRCALEVKAVGSTSTSIEIHGIRQLEPPNVPLSLVVVTLNEGPTGSTLSDLVEVTLARATHRPNLVSLLAAAGYDREDDHRYASFAVDGVFHVPVTDAVPRLVSTSLIGGGLPTGVADLTYSVDLAALRPLSGGGGSAVAAWTADPR